MHAGHPYDYSIIAASFIDIPDDIPDLENC